MSRDVHVPDDAEAHAFFRIPEDEDAREFVDDISRTLAHAAVARWTTMLPLCPAEPRGYEESIVAANAIARIGLSVYGDMVSVWIVPAHAFRAHSRWLERAASRFPVWVTRELGVEVLYSLGTMSNGQRAYTPLATLLRR